MKFSRFLTENDKKEFKEQILANALQQFSLERDEIAEAAVKILCKRTYEIIAQDIEETAESWLTTLKLETAVYTRDSDGNALTPDGQFEFSVYCTEALDTQLNTTLEALLTERIRYSDDPITDRSFIAASLRTLADRIETNGSNLTPATCRSTA